MKAIEHAILLFLLSIVLVGCKSKLQGTEWYEDDRITYHKIDPNTQQLAFYKAKNGFLSFAKLAEELDSIGQKLVFAMNGGMFKKDFSPQGLYIENGQLITPLDTIKEKFGNFYLQPNGVFYLTKEQKGVISTTPNFKWQENISYATQSGPMLVIDGNIHSKFNKGSSNLHIRNGVGVLANGKLLFAISREKINLYDFATFFKANGCQNALYLDGFISKMYLPEKGWKEQDGKFGVVIASTKK